MANHKAFFDAATNTVTYVVWDPATRAAARQWREARAVETARAGPPCMRRIRPVMARRAPRAILAM